MANKGCSKKKSKCCEPLDDNDECVDATATIEDLRAYLNKAKAEIDPLSFVKSLPASVQKRIKALKNLQLDYTKIEQQFQIEVAALEAKYAAKYRPLLDKRSDIVIGSYEPTDKECEWNLDDADDDGAVSPKIVEIKEDGESAISGLTDDMQKVTVESSVDAAGASDNDADDTSKENIVGIPEFWLTVLKNADLLTDMVKDHDEPLLKHLIDLKIVFTDDQGLDFTLEFHFSDNEYFTNKVLTKSYVVECKIDEDDPFSFDGPTIIKTAGCKIDWKKGKNLTIKTVKKKQRHKGRGQTRTITKTVPNESFFNFFDPPAPPKEDDDDDDEDYLVMETLEADFARAEYLKDKVIPEAVLYFTGEVVEDYDDLEEEEDEDMEDEDEDDDKYADDDEGKRQGQKPSECKQQ